MEKIVKGATKIKLAAPKSKYIEPILSATNGGESGVAEVFRTLQMRLRDSTWTIVFKSLIVVHMMIREGQSETTLRYIAESPKRLAISSFTEVQTQGLNIRRYSEYLLEKVRAYRDTKTDFVKSGTGKMRKLTVDRGLLRQTEVVQEQIRALLRCDLLGSHDPDNEITLTAFRLLTMDLLELFKVMNEGTINVLEHYFEMSRPDAERALSIYKTFGKQTDQVVQYLSLARQYEMSTRLEVPKLKHAPTTLTSSLEEYLNDPDFEINRRQYLAQQEAKRTGKPAAAITRTRPPTSELPAKVDSSFPASSSGPAQSQPRGPAPDLMDFFESIEQNQQPMAQQAPVPGMPVQQYNMGMAQPQAFQMPPQSTGYNPFMQQAFAPQSQPLQPEFTGAGFGGYTPQPQQFQQPQNTQQYAFASPLSTIPQNGVADFQQPTVQSPTQHLQSPTQPLQAQPTSTNPFRQSTLPPGAMDGFPQPVPTRQSTNPFAKTPGGLQPSPSGPYFSQSPPPQFGAQQPPVPVQSQQQELQSTSSFFNTASSPTQGPDPTFQQAPLQAQQTGTNPFAKSRQPPPAAPLVANVTGSTNPFRQSAFVNQQTGQGWQHGNQGTFSGFDLNHVDTTPVFPRPGAH